MKRINKRVLLGGSVLALLGGLLYMSYVRHNRYYDSTELARYVREHIAGHPTPVSPVRESAETAEGSDRSSSEEDSKPASPSDRINQYLWNADKTDKTIQEFTRDCFFPSDIEVLYADLSVPKASLIWFQELRAICILEEDADRAFTVARLFMERREDWRQIALATGEKYNNMDPMKPYRRFLCASAFGFIESEQAREYITELLDRGRVKELAQQITVPPNTISIEEATTLIQESAAFGLMFTLDDEAFQPVVDAFEKGYYEHRGEGLEMYRMVTRWRRIIGLYRFYKDVGYEEGCKILAGLDEYDVSPVSDYIPKFPGMKDDGRQGEIAEPGEPKVPRSPSDV